jgi:multidrug resistance efflux pump
MATRFSPARVLRRLLGLGLFSLGGWLVSAWLLWPGLWSITSSKAVVTARILTLHSPIEGSVSTPPPPVGKAVAAGTPLLQVENALVDTSHLEELKTEAAALAERVAALKVQQRDLEVLKERLATDASRYHQAAVGRLERQVQEAKAAAAATEAIRKQRAYRKGQLAQLVRDRSVGTLEMVTAELEADAAQGRADQAHAAVQRLAEELEAVRGGGFAGLGEGRADVPYSQQRVHDIALRQHDLAARLQEHSVRHAQVQRQLHIEAERLQRQAAAWIYAPIDGVVWRRPAVRGAAVTRQTELVQLLDASEIFVDALVSESYFGALRPGDPVVIRLIGSHAEVAGVVRDVLGQAAPAEDRTLAAQPPKAGQHEIHVLVAFADGPPNTDHFHPHHIGQPAEVRFVHSTGLLRRLWDLVAP